MKDITLLIETSGAVVRRLDRLCLTGFYGDTREAVAEELLRIALREHDTPDFLAERESEFDGEHEDRR